MKNEFVLTYPVELIGSLSGLVTVPTGFDPEKESLPVILYLHGAGERGSDVELVKAHGGIPTYFSENPDFMGVRAITLTPSCPDGVIWPHLVYPIMTWLRAAVAELNGDPHRISITGCSMGGFGTWEMLCTFPKVFSCGSPICGGGLSWRAGLLRGQKIRVYHGLDDTVVPITYSQMMVDSARACGADIEFFAYDKVGHLSGIKAYLETDLIEWLVTQRLENPGL